MFCKKCGKEINSGASFCPHCGNSISDGVILKNDLESNNSFKKKKRWKYISFIIIAVILLIFPVKNSIEKSIVKSIAEDYLQMIKDGPDEEIMDDIVVQLLYGFMENETLANFLHEHITGADVRDLYDAVMLYMDYEVKSVEKVGSGHYRVTVRIENMNNIIVASEAWKIFSKRYTNGNLLDAIIQAKDDLLSDKSMLISGFIIEASNDLHTRDKTHNMVAGIHIIDVRKTDNGWEPFFMDGVDAFIFDCAGIPY